MARLSSSLVAAFMFMAALSNALPTATPTAVQQQDDVPVTLPESPDFLPLNMDHFTHNQIQDEALGGIADGLKAREAPDDDSFPTPTGGPDFFATPNPTAAKHKSTPTPTPSSSSNNPFENIPILGPIAGAIFGEGLIPK